MSDPNAPVPPWEQPGGQPPYGQASYGQPLHGQPPYAPELPRHPQAGTALALGIIGLLGSMVGVGLLVSPFAWFVGGRAVREMDRHPGRWSGRDQAQAGRVMGIIGTVLLVLLVVLLVVVVAAVIAFWPTIQVEIEQGGGTGNVSV